MKKTKTLCLLSGGLDSRLACKIMQEQCEVEAVFFILPFGAGCCSDKFCVFRFAQTNRFKLHIIDCTKGKMFKEYFKIIKKPKHGYGSAINPCIDCHIFMLKEAKKLSRKIKADFLVTGEVLNERPMSQHLTALNLVEKESGLDGLLLRPLSAKLLKETEAEKKVLIDRKKLLAISGRSRKEQMALAEKLQIKYPSPGGGCLLCEKDFAAKLRDLFRNEKKIAEKDIELLKIGRHFRIENAKVIIGRNEQENNLIEKSSEKSDLLLEAAGIPSPIALIRKREKISEKAMEKTAAITARYSDSKESKVLVQVKSNGKIKREIYAEKTPQAEINSLRIK